MIGRERILDLVPHTGRMCLIERVLEWSDTEIICESDNHRDPAHPLRRPAGLSSVCLIEYGAQAAAIHSTLLGTLMGSDPGSDPESGSDPINVPNNAKRPAMLVSVRNCELRVGHLRDLTGPLKVLARVELARSDGLIYAFEVSNAARPLASGRIGILLGAPEWTADTSRR
jgi:predicted hotdog family 3-hydroxylacyl-ACP dehydratase